MKALTIAFVILAKVGGLFAPPIPQAYHDDWQPTRSMLTLPPMAIQTTGGIRLPLNDGVPWHGPAGSLMAVSRGTSPHRHRDTGVLIPPMQRLHPARLTPIPAAPEMPSWAAQEALEKQYSDAIARIDSARLPRLYDELPESAALVLQPLDSQELSVADRTAVSRTTDKPSDAMVGLAELASQQDDDDTKEVPAYMRNRAQQLQQRLRESEWNNDRYLKA
jgi:hypothetical protein